jgi:hypothetical protein
MVSSTTIQPHFFRPFMPHPQINAAQLAAAPVELAAGAHQEHGVMVAGAGAAAPVLPRRAAAAAELAGMQGEARPVMANPFPLEPRRGGAARRGAGR